MSVYLPSKHWLIALIPLSVALAALSNNFIIRESKHVINHPPPGEYNKASRVKSGSPGPGQLDTAEAGAKAKFRKTDSVKNYREPEASLKTGNKPREGLFKNGRFDIDID